MQKYQITQAFDYIYVRQQTRSLLVQIINCQPFGTKPSPETMLNYCQFDIHTNLCEFLIKLQTSQLNAAEKVVCKMLVILFLPQYVKGIKNGCPCIVEIRGTQGCALVGDPARAVGECRDVAKAQP